MNLLVSNPLTSKTQPDTFGFLQVLAGASEQSEQSASSAGQEDSRHTTQRTLEQEPATAGTQIEPGPALEGWSGSAERKTQTLAPSSERNVRSTSVVSGKATFSSTGGGIEWLGNPEAPATTVLAARIAAIVSRTSAQPLSQSATAIACGTQSQTLSLASVKPRIGSDGETTGAEASTPTNFSKTPRFSIARLVVSSVNNSLATIKPTTTEKETPARGPVPESPAPVASVQATPTHSQDSAAQVAGQSAVAAPVPAPEAEVGPASTANQASATLEHTNSVGRSSDLVSAAAVAWQPLNPDTADDANAASQKLVENPSNSAPKTAPSTISDSASGVTGTSTQPQESAPSEGRVTIERALPLLSFNGRFASNADFEMTPRQFSESADAKTTAPAAQPSASLESQPIDPTGTNAQSGSAVQAPAQATIPANTVPVSQPNNHMLAFQSTQSRGTATADSAKNAAEPDAGTPSNPATETSTQTSAMAHATTSESQPLQHAPADASQATTVAPGRLVEGNATQAQTVASPAENHDLAPSAHRFEGAADSPRTPEQPADPQATDQTASMGINAAKIIQTMDHSEMRVGMHTADFGAISIRTSVSQQHMTAEISVNHSELGRAILAQIPSMREKFGEMGLRAAVEVSQGAGSSSGDSPQSSSKEQRPAVSATHVLSEAVSSTPELSALPVAAPTAEKDRLDIRA